MIDLGITEADFHTRWHLTICKNQLLKELENTVGDAEMYKVARELKRVVKELQELPKEDKKEVAVCIADDCNSCPYTKTIQRKYGETHHCMLEVSHMDVTHVKGANEFCPLNYFKK